MSKFEASSSPAVPPSLRSWFVVDAVITGVGLGLPLLLVPELILPRFGWTAVDPVTSRLAGAACLAIGWQSWRKRLGDATSYRALLGLKAIWCSAGILGLVIAAGVGAPPAVWAVIAWLLVWDGVWLHHGIRLRRAAAAEPLGPATGLEEWATGSVPSDPDEDLPTEDLGPPARARPGKRSNDRPGASEGLPTTSLS